MSWKRWIVVAAVVYGGLWLGSRWVKPAPVYAQIPNQAPVVQEFMAANPEAFSSGTFSTRVVIVGMTDGPGFPVTPGAFDSTSNGSDGFISVFGLER